MHAEETTPACYGHWLQFLPVKVWFVLQNHTAIGHCMLAWFCPYENVDHLFLLGYVQKTYFAYNYSPITPYNMPSAHTLSLKSHSVLLLNTTSIDSVFPQIPTFKEEQGMHN